MKIYYSLKKKKKSSNLSREKQYMVKESFNFGFQLVWIFIDTQFLRHYWGEKEKR